MIVYDNEKLYTLADVSEITGKIDTRNVRKTVLRYGIPNQMFSDEEIRKINRDSRGYFRPGTLFFTERGFRTLLIYLDLLPQFDKNAKHITKEKA